MSNKMNRFVYILLVLIMLVVVSGCAKPQPAGLSDDQVGTMVDNILQAINAGDYQNFKRDFSDAMITAFPETEFTKLHDLIQGTSGNYISLGELTLINQSGYAIYLFQCEYDKENVVVKVVFAIGGDKVDGLFFDSTNLRTASK